MYNSFVLVVQQQHKQAEKMQMRPNNLDRQIHPACKIRCLSHLPWGATKQLAKRTKTSLETPVARCPKFPQKNKTHHYRASSAPFRAKTDALATKK
jgi:hypothetical protein